MRGLRCAAATITAAAPSTSPRWRKGASAWWTRRAGSPWWGSRARPSQSRQRDGPWRKGKRARVSLCLRERQISIGLGITAIAFGTLRGRLELSAPGRGASVATVTAARIRLQSRRARGHDGAAPAWPDRADPGARMIARPRLALACFAALVAAPLAAAAEDFLQEGWYLGARGVYTQNDFDTEGVAEDGFGFNLLAG